jgi:hypothetical protein
VGVKIHVDPHLARIGSQEYQGLARLGGGFDSRRLHHRKEFEPASGLSWPRGGASDPLHRRRPEHLLAAAARPSSSSRSASTLRSVSTSALARAWVPRPSPMKSTKLARRRSSAPARPASCGALFARKAAASFPAGPASPHFLASRASLLPQRLRHDAQRLVILYRPLGLRLGEPAPSPRPSAGGPGATMRAR